MILYCEGPHAVHDRKLPIFCPDGRRPQQITRPGRPRSWFKGLKACAFATMRGGFALEPASSVMEKRIFVGLLARKSVRYGQRATLVGLQRNFLCQHDVACDEVTFGRKAPTNTRTAGAVELVDVHRGAVPNPVSLSAVAAGDLKIAFRVILRGLLRR